MYDLSEKDYREWKYAGEKWFQKTKEKIAAEKSAKLISYKEFDLSNEKQGEWKSAFKEWKSAYYEEQLQEMKQRKEESLLDPYQCSESERKLLFPSDRGESSIKQWRENLHNSSEKKAQKAILGDTPPSDTISNDADKELAITDIGKKSVAIELINDKKEGTNLSESTDLISSNNVSVAELPKNSDEILPIIPTNSSSVDDTDCNTKQSDNEEQNNYIDRKIEPDNASQYSLDTDEGENSDEEENSSENVNITDGNGKIEDTEDATYLSVDNSSGVVSSGASSSTNDQYPAVDTKSPFASLVGVVTSAWHSFTKIFHKTKPTGDAVLDTSDSLPAKSSFVGDNLNDDVDAIGCISEPDNNLFDQD